MMIDKIKKVHQGRGGYLEYDGAQYIIEHVESGSFVIHFPSGNKHDQLQIHFCVLTRFAANQDPKWYVSKG